MGFPFRETINYPGWVTFVDGHIEKIVHAFRIGDNYVEVFTENGHRYVYERIFEDPRRDSECIRIILPSHQFSKLENGQWLDADDVRDFSFNINV